MDRINSQNIENIREVNFFRDNLKVSYPEIFERVYSSLERLIDYNRGAYTRLRGRINRDERVEDERRAIYTGSKEELHRLRDLSVLIKFDNGARIFEIRSRTNFKSTLTKIPNIIYLLGDDGKIFILRESRDYKENPLVHLDAKSVFNSHYKGNISEIKKEKANKKGVFSVPEPKLIFALEQMYEEFKIPKITPDVRIVRVKDGNFCSIRNSLFSVRDGHLDLDKFVSYEGVLNGLGLMDVLDSDYSHYCINFNDQVVNIDPDFWTYSPHERFIDTLDWRQFKSVFEKEHLNGFHIRKELSKIRTKVMRDIKKKFGDRSIVDYIPSDLSASLSKSSVLKSLSSDDVFESL